MAGLRPSGLPRSGLVQRRFRQVSLDSVEGEFNLIRNEGLLYSSAPAP